MKLLFALITILLFNFAASTPARAVCPVCTVAVGAGLGISRWLGIDDAITGVWVGGLIVSSGLWMADWIQKKKWKIPYTKFLSVIIFGLLVLIPLYWSQIIGLPGNTLWGLDKFILGTGAGTLIFLLSVELDRWIRTKNQGRVLFFYQKVIIPVVLLLLTSLAFYFITK